MAADPAKSTKTVSLKPSASGGWEGRIVLVWLLLAIGCSLAFNLEKVFWPFDYAHASASAGISVMARSFAEHGIIHLGGVPIENNGAIGKIPSPYTHWPPLLPIALSILFRLFGDREAAGHALILIINTITACGLFVFLRRLAGPAASMFGLFSWLTLGVTAVYGILISHQALGVMFSVLSLICFQCAVRSETRSNIWSLLTLLLISLAVWSSWEPALIPVGLLIGAYWSKDAASLRMARATAAAAWLSALAVCLLYFVRYPEMLGDTLHAAAFWTRLSDSYSAMDHRPHVALKYVLYEVRENLDLTLGALALAALVTCAAVFLDRYFGRRIDASAVPYLGCASLWVFWCATMPEHLAGQAFEACTIAPSAALAMGRCFEQILGTIRRPPGQRRIFRSALAVVVVPGFLFSGWVENALLASREHASLPEAQAPILMGRWILSVTEPSSVVVEAEGSMVPVYYSKRHTIRGVSGQQELARVFPWIQENLGQVPVYLLATLADSADWRSLATRYPLFSSSEQGKLYCASNCAVTPPVTAKHD